MSCDVITWSWGRILRDSAFMLIHHPVGLVKGGLALGFRSLSNPVYWFKNIITFLRAMSILADVGRHGITHLHASFGSSPATVAWLSKLILGTTYSITFHSFEVYTRQRQYMDPLRTTKMRGANLIIPVYDEARQVLSALLPERDRSKFKVIHIAVDFDPDAKIVPLPEPPLLIAVGNLVNEKGFDVLVRAMRILKQRRVPARALILGDGPERSFLERLIREEQVNDRVELAGFFPHGELARHLAKASALVAPSRVGRYGLRDGIPTVIVEAWLGRTPVVASVTGGMAEVIIEGETGVVFASDDPEALADSVERLLGDGELRARIVDAGYVKARAAFSPAKNVRKLLDLIEERAVRAGAART